MAHVLIVDDELSMREFLQILMEGEGHTVSVAPSVAKARSLVREQDFELVLTDLKLTDGDGLDVLKCVREEQPDSQIIMLTAYATTETAVEAMRLGAYDYQIKPIKVGEVRALTTKALEKVALIRENRELSNKLNQRITLDRLVGQSAAMRALVKLLTKVSPTTSTVLIEGESGTGKELVAQAIHQSSPRADAPFVAVNCGAIPESLIEAELFGHVAGAFTGAGKARAGLFETAHTGTLLLDEVGELPLAMQVKLLRVLQERRVRRVGDDKERDVDVRVVASTNRDLQEMVTEGTFREDLFYRLNVVRVRVPPLRDRRDDIPVLVRQFIAKLSVQIGKEVSGIAPDALRAVMNWSYPGNVRELENAVERGITLASDDLLRLEDLPEEFAGEANLPDLDENLLAFLDEGVNLEARLQELEAQFIREALKRSGGVKKRAAELLGLSFRSFRYRLQKLGLADDEPEESLE